METRSNILDRSIAIVKRHQADTDIVRFEAIDALEAKAIAAAMTYAIHERASGEGRLKDDLDTLIKNQKFTYDQNSHQGQITLPKTSTTLKRGDVLDDIQKNLQTFQRMYTLNRKAEALMFEESNDLIIITPRKDRPQYAQHLSPMQGRLLQLIGEHHGRSVQYNIIMNLPSDVKATPDHPATISEADIAKIQDNVSKPGLKEFTTLEKSPGQKELARLLNDVIKTIGISADDLDRHFRVSLMHQISLLSNAPVLALHQKIRVKSPGTVNTPAIGEASKRLEEEMGFLGDGQLKIVIPHGMDNKALIEGVVDATSLETTIAEALTYLLNTHLGRFQDVNPSGSSQQQRYFNHFKHLVRNFDNFQPKTNGEGINLLQEILNKDTSYLSNKDSPLEMGSLRGWKRGEINYYVPQALSYYVFNALFNAISYAAAEKGWDIPKQEKIIGPIREKIWPIVTPWIAGISTSYIPNTSLDEPQKRFFSALNKVVELTGDPVVTFDHNLRSKLYNYIQTDSYYVSKQMNRYLREAGVNVQDVLLGGYTPADDELTVKLRPVLKHSDALWTDAALKEIMPHMRGAEYQKAVQRDMHGFLADHIPGFKQLELSDSGLIANSLNKQFVSDTRKVLGDHAIEEYTGRQLLLDAFAKGEKKLSLLAKARFTGLVTPYFEASHASAGDVVMNAIESTAHSLARDNKRDNGQLKQALEELRAAYREAILAPEERAAEAEKVRQIAEEAERQRLARIEEARIAAQAAEAEKRRQAEEKMLTFEPYDAFSPLLVSLHTRATRRTNPPPVAALKDLWERELAPLRQALNKNFPPHEKLGGVLCTQPSLNLLDQICTAKTIETADLSQRQSLQDLFKEFVSKEIGALPFTCNDELRPRIVEMNQPHHEAALAVLAKSPLILIAAFGDKQQLEKAREVQQALFPLDKKDRKKAPKEESDRLAGEATRMEIAIAAVEKHGDSELKKLLDVMRREKERLENETFAAIEKETEIKLKAEAAKPVVPPKPPSPPSPPSLVPPLVAGGAIIVTAASVRTPDKTPPQPLPVEATAPASPIIEQQPPATLQPPVSTPPMTAKEIISVKGKVVDFLMGHLKDKPPYTLFSCGVIGPNGEKTCRLTLSLSRFVYEGGKFQREKVETQISLSTTDTNEALRLRDEIQHMVRSEPLHELDHKLRDATLEKFRKSVIPNTAPIVEDTKVINKNGVWQLKLTFAPSSSGQPKQEFHIPLGLQAEDRDKTVPDAANDRKDIVLAYLDERRSAPATTKRTEIITTQNVRDSLRSSLGEAVWQGPRRIDLQNDERVDFEITTTTTFPPGHKTRITLKDPIYEGTPTGEWKIPVTFCYEVMEDGKDVSKEFSIQINTHAGTEERALDCAPNILLHLKQALNAYAGAHPEATWLSAPRANGLLAEPLSKHSVNMDKNKLDLIVAGLEYACRFKAKASDITAYDNDVATGPASFMVTASQRDGAQFYGKLKSGEIVPLRANCQIVGEKLTKDSIKQCMKEFSYAVQASFTDLLRAKFSPRLINPEQPDTIPIPEKTVGAIDYLLDHHRGRAAAQSLHGYQPATVQKAFETAFQQALKLSQEKGWSVTGSLETMAYSTAGAGPGNGSKPSDPPRRTEFGERMTRKGIRESRGSEKPEDFKQRQI